MNLTRKRIVTRLLLIVGGLVIGLLIVEGGLRLYESLTGHVNIDLEGRSQVVTDDKVGVRVLPGAPGHDARGFRNADVPLDTDIVCIGDSQTWGNNAAANHAWPQTLGRLADRTAYNMGLGYYGPVEYMYLAEEALELSPEVIVIGLYLGNDIWGAYNTVYLSDRCPDLRAPNAAHDLFVDTISGEAEDLFTDQEETKTGLQGSFLYRWAMNLREYSAAVRQLTDGLGNLLNPAYTQGKAWAQANPDQGAYYESEGIKKVLTPAYRLLAMATEEPGIREGLRITKETILAIQSKTADENAGLVILLIPTAESVYADAVQATQASFSSTYQELVRTENRLKEEIITLCDDNGIEYADALPSLKAAVGRNAKLYPESTDGHPLAMGYYCIASAVYEKLTGLGWLE